jgi:hypothetical protein
LRGDRIQGFRVEKQGSARRRAMTRYDFLSVLTSLEMEVLKLARFGPEDDDSARALREAWDRTARLFQKTCPEDEVPVPFWMSPGPGDGEPLSFGSAALGSQ